MQNKEKDFFQLTGKLTALAITRKNERRQKYTQELRGYLSTIEPLYRGKVTHYYERYIKPFEAEFSFLRTSSVLSVISKLRQERFHSAILWYLLDESRAKDALSTLAPSVNLSDYEICKEHFFKADRKNRIKQGSIDIFIWSEKNKWVIAIENKVDAGVRKLDDTSTQISNYSRYLSVNYADYSVFKILLSYRDNADDCSDGWVFVDYSILFKALSASLYRDRIMEDYLTTLFQLLVGEYEELTPEYLSLYSAREFDKLITKPYIKNNYE